MASIEVVHWNPIRSRFTGPLRRFLPKKPVNNFGDLLGPIIVTEILRQRGVDPDSAPTPRRLLAVGSILRLAHDGDVVWGPGANGKSLTHGLPARHLDVRAVRGPLTRAFLAEKGIDSPPVYGDPGLLVGALWNRADLARSSPERDITIIPNLNDLDSWPEQEGMLDPRTPVWECLAAIAASRLVVGSSLHAVIVAESLGVPARLVRSQAEPMFKYDDYFQGTGRETPGVATSVEEAIDMGGADPLEWDPDPLLRAFPLDLWTENAS